MSNNSGDSIKEKKLQRLSIQVGLNGLSFCTIDTVTERLIASGHVSFKAPSTPYLVQKKLKSLLSDKGLVDDSFSEINVVHKNNLFALVPKDLFDKNELPNYLKLNAKLLANDHIDYDEIPNVDIVNVYVPLVNINNYLFEIFGEFEFKHSGTVLIQTLISQNQKSKEPICYAYVSKRTFELVILKHNRLLFYNQLEYKTKEDFLYYILFTYEQLSLDTEVVDLKMFGHIEEDDDIFSICYEYIKKVSVFITVGVSYLSEDESQNSFDLTLLNA